ncbi:MULTISPECIES: hypothetical protein [Haloarcula]|uniref:Uncharacterized protein n=1 Tax=Haloarcula pellucida TaxID=1427151 RepID=A0A830GNB0_9EURY|nr:MULTISPECIES: hypothetical protein [Halomicroarcula]MBX0349874.1 hypothetical protein [Halomicroarcula pellucida]MDS0279617.1 hypothetical protein [Halomicroarcula sp. S1AR25-4]GGN94778.1 hypothetical protein GCM10009030_21440 [Halomicroarcula pellucida]
MTDVQSRLEETRAVRHVAEPTSLPVFRSVTRIWHFPSGDALLELADHRDCLLPNVDRVDVPASERERVGDAVALDTETAVRVSEEQGRVIIKEFDKKIIL